MSPADGAAVADEIRRMEAARCRAIVDADRDALERILAADLIYTHSSGVTEGRDAFIARVQTRLYRRIQPRDFAVRVHDGVAIVSGHAEIDTEANGNRKSLFVRFVNVWVQADSAWQNSIWQATIAPVSGAA